MKFYDDIRRPWNFNPAPGDSTGGFGVMRDVICVQCGCTIKPDEDCYDDEAPDSCWVEAFLCVACWKEHLE